MEINTQQMDALLQVQEQQAQLPRRNASAGKGFENLLEANLASAADPATVSELLKTNEAGALYRQILLNPAEDTRNTDPDAAVLDAAFSQASGALDLWNDYASLIGRADSASLRNAYSMLETIDAQISDMRANSTFGSNPNLGGFLNELEVLSAVEKFKFNRGDYVA